MGTPFTGRKYAELDDRHGDRLADIKLMSSIHMSAFAKCTVARAASRVHVVRGALTFLLTFFPHWNTTILFWTRSV